MISGKTSPIERDLPASVLFVARPVRPVALINYLKALMAISSLLEGWFLATLSPSVGGMKQVEAAGFGRDPGRGCVESG